MTLYFLSDEAYNKLTIYGQRQGYIKVNIERVNGMSAFLSDLPYANFMDTRPQLVRQRHAEEIKHHHAPSWTSYYTRRPRQITLSEEVMLRYVEKAINFNILTIEPYAIGGQSRRTMIPIVSIILEAIGLEWMTPVYFPLKDNPMFQGNPESYAKQI